MHSWLNLTLENIFKVDYQVTVCSVSSKYITQSGNAKLDSQNAIGYNNK